MDIFDRLRECLEESEKALARTRVILASAGIDMDLECAKSKQLRFTKFVSNPISPISVHPLIKYSAPYIPTQHTHHC